MPYSDGTLSLTLHSVARDKTGDHGTPDFRCLILTDISLGSTHSSLFSDRELPEDRTNPYMSPQLERVAATDSPPVFNTQPQSLPFTTEKT